LKLDGFVHLSLRGTKQSYFVPLFLIGKGTKF
jgi:hypothetical protein